LILEKDNLEGEFLHNKRIKSLLQMYMTNLDFVYIATCNAGFAVKAFADAGARHSIGVKTGVPVLDAAALTFTRAFYTRLWEPGSKICECYESAVMNIRLEFNDAEADKFDILKSN